MSDRGGIYFYGFRFVMSGPAEDLVIVVRAKKYHKNKIKLMKIGSRADEELTIN